MDKNTIGSFLWILVTVIIMLSLLAFASPFGVYIKDNINTFTGEYIEKNDESEKDETTPYCNLTITYKVSDDASKNIPSYKKVLKKYERYSIVSPEIAGYRPNTTVVEGVITSDTNVEVLYTLGTYNIKYITNEGAFSSDPRSSYIYKDSFNLPSGATLKRDNYVFAGWYETKDFEGTKVTKITSTDYGDKVFYAKWIPANYKITYVLNDKASETGSNGTGYYYRAKEAKNPEDLAKWDNEVLDSSGKLKPEYTSFDYGSQLKLPVSVSKFGYTFIGWSTEKTGTDKDAYRTQITESDSTDIVLYAQWKRNVYKIEYHLGFTRPDRLDKNGNTIKGEEAEFNIICDSYTVTDGDGNTAIYSGYPTRYTYGDTITLPSTVYYPGYDQYLDLELWFNKQSETVKVTRVGNRPSTTSELQKYLGHIKSDAQNIRKNANDSSHQVISPVSSLFAPDNTRGDIDKGRYDHTNLDLYVRPVPNNYYIKFDENKPTDAIYRTGTETMSTQTFVYDYTTKLKKNTFAYMGYSFVGWNTKPDGKGESFTDEQYIDNLTTTKNETITLYAQWKVEKVDVTYQYYFHNLNGVGYSKDESIKADVVEQYYADTTQDASPYMIQIDGFTYSHGEKWYNDVKTHIDTKEDDLIEGNCTFRVLPSGKRIIKLYYNRNGYNLTFISQPKDMFTDATVKTSQGGISKAITPSNNSITIENVLYGDTLTFTSNHEKQYRVKIWTSSDGVTSPDNAVGFTRTMPSCNITVFLYNEWNMATITFYANDNDGGQTASNWGRGASQQLDFIYEMPYSNTGFPSIWRQCYTLEGWYTKNGAKINESDIFHYGDDLELYAHWTWNDANNGCHLWRNEINTAATCTNNGYIKDVCSHCGRVRESWPAALGHASLKWEQTGWATCGEGGSMVGKCSRCDEELSRINQPALGHLKDRQKNMYAECNQQHNPGHALVDLRYHKCLNGYKGKVCYRHVTCGRNNYGKPCKFGNKNGGTVEKWCLKHSRNGGVYPCGCHEHGSGVKYGMTDCPGEWNSGLK